MTSAFKSLSVANQRPGVIIVVSDFWDKGDVADAFQQGPRPGLVQFLVLPGKPGALLLAFELQGRPIPFDGGLLGLEGLTQFAQFPALFRELAALLFEFALPCIELLRPCRQFLVAVREFLRDLGISAAAMRPASRPIAALST